MLATRPLHSSDATALLLRYAAPTSLRFNYRYGLHEAARVRVQAERDAYLYFFGASIS